MKTMGKLSCSSKMKMGGQLHVPAALSPGKELRYSLYMSFSGPQSRSGRYGKGNILPITGNRTPNPRSSCS
jgi:hypothetical protein